MRILGNGVDAPFGLKPWGRQRSFRWVYVEASATAIYQFSPVYGGANGGVNIVTAEAGGVSSGYVLGTALQYRASTATAGWIMICDDPDQIYEIQGDDGSGTPAQADVNANAVMIATHTPTYRTSAIELDVSSVANTATHQLRIIGKNESDSWGAYTRYLVRINYHDSLDTTGI